VLKRRNIDPRNASVLEVAYAKTGSMLKAARVAAFVVGWGAVRDELGRTPTVEEYAEWWRENERTAYRHMAEFREVFNRCETPDPVLDLMAAQRVQPSGRFDLAAVVA
jgi:predicted kinase